MSELLNVTFQDSALAERAVGALLDHGLAESDIKPVEPAIGDPVGSARQHLTTTTPVDVACGAMKGGVIGLVVGTLLAMISIMVPGYGLVVIGGTLPMAIAAAAAATAGGRWSGVWSAILSTRGWAVKPAKRSPPAPPGLPWPCASRSSSTIVRARAA